MKNKKIIYAIIGIAILISMVVIIAIISNKPMPIDHTPKESTSIIEELKKKYSDKKYLKLTGGEMLNEDTCFSKYSFINNNSIYIFNPEKLDIEAMREAVPYLLGPKNFTSFTDDKECKDPIRKITNIKIVSSGEKVRITYYGTGFLYHMVRILTGTLLEIGAGKRDASMLPVVIAAEDRSLAGFLAPARGLFLRKVYY